MHSYRDLLQQVKAEIDEVDATGAAALLDGPQAPALIDVRERDEWEEGKIPGAVHVPRGFLESRIEQVVPDRDAPIVVYCAGGSRSAFAAKTLGELGYTNVSSLAGGYTEWKRAGFPWETPRSLDAAKRARYSRHLLIPEVGEEGQLKLLDSRVLMLGAGGLGSPAALYLAAAGVGTIGIVDMDVVDLSNLQRQILHTNDRVGMPKVESARMTLQALNPDVRIVEFRERLSSENAFRIFEQFDLTLNGCDNFPTRYLVNDACVLLGIPNAYGSIFRFDGQASVFATKGGPCYRCLYPEPPPPGLVPSCAEGGVLGVLPGIIGTIQATEAIKLILGIGNTLVGRLLLLDALSMEFRTMKLRRDPACPVCGDHPTVKALIDYQQFCGIPAATAAAASTPAVPEITVDAPTIAKDGVHRHFVLLLVVREGDISTCGLT
jgi:adenylyltransferase/sulfurtransferase